MFAALAPLRIWLLQKLGFLDVSRFKLAGKFVGWPRLEWHADRDWVVILDQPFAFVRACGERIDVGAMDTDGGSVPRVAWGLTDFDPWTYGPAYVIHDWLFAQHHRGDMLHSFEDANQILAEAIWTLMAGGQAPASDWRLWAIFEAVSSPIGLAYWNGSK